MRPGEKPEITRLPLFRDMNDSERERIFASSFLEVFPPRLTLFSAGQSADFLYILVDGLVEMLASSGGRKTVIRVLEPVSSFILAAAILDLEFLMSARTLVASRIMLVPSNLLRDAVCRDVALMKATMHKLALGSRELVLALAQVKLRPSIERLGIWLLAQDAQTEEQGNFRLRAEKRVLTSLLGMTPENLARAFASLSEHGIIIDGPNVTITDRAALQSFVRPDPV